MELPDVEVVPQLLLRPLPQLEDLDLADLVCRGLARPGDVASDLSPDNAHGDDPGHDDPLSDSPEALLAGGGVIQHELNSLLLCPAKSVHPSVNNCVLNVNTQYQDKRDLYQVDRLEISLHSSDQICPGDLHRH